MCDIIYRSTIQNNLRFFSLLSHKEQNILFYLTCKNHLRPYKKNSDLYKTYFSFLEFIFQNLDNREAIIQEVQKIIKTIVIHQPYLLDIDTIYMVIKGQYTPIKDPFALALAINTSLLLLGCCPIIFYAFNRWLFIQNMDREYICKLLELSLASLLRTVPLKLNYKLPFNVTLFNTNGGIFNIFYSPNENVIYKIPKNLAAYKFLANQEFYAYQYYWKTPLKKFLIPDLRYIKTKAIIKHRFISGKTGEDFLFNNTSFTTEQIQSLECFYYTYKKLNNSLKLDVHPGNFI